MGKNKDKNKNAVPSGQTMAIADDGSLDNNGAKKKNDKTGATTPSATAVKEAKNWVDHNKK